MSILFCCFVLQGVLAEINSGFYKSEKLDVKIPKFSVSGSLELSNELDKLGMGSVFSADGNFTGFLGPDETAEVKFKKAIHKSFIEVKLFLLFSTIKICH